MYTLDGPWHPVRRAGAKGGHTGWRLLLTVGALLRLSEELLALRLDACLLLCELRLHVVRLGASTAILRLARRCEALACVRRGGVSLRRRAIQLAGTTLRELMGLRLAVAGEGKRRAWALRGALVHVGRVERGNVVRLGPVGHARRVAHLCMNDALGDEEGTGGQPKFERARVCNARARGRKAGRTSEVPRAGPGREGTHPGALRGTVDEPDGGQGCPWVASRDARTRKGARPVD